MDGHPPVSWFHSYTIEGLDHTECRPLLRLPGSIVSPMKNVVSLGRKMVVLCGFYSIENGEDIVETCWKTNCCIHNRRVAMHIPCNKNSASINASLPESQRKNTKKTSKCQSLFSHPSSNSRTWTIAATPAVPKKTTTYPVHPWVNHQLFVAQNPPKKRKDMERQPTSVQSPLKLSSI